MPLYVFESIKKAKKINKAIIVWNIKIQYTHSYLLSNHFAQATPFHHSSLQLTVQFVAPIFSPPYYFDRRFINRSRNNLVSRAILFFATTRFLFGPYWIPLGRRVSFIQDHISTLISRMVIHRSHDPGLLSARSSSSSSVSFFLLPPAVVRA